MWHISLRELYQEIHQQVHITHTLYTIICECGRLCVHTHTPREKDDGDEDGDGLNIGFTFVVPQCKRQKRKQSVRYHGCRKCQNSQTRAKLHNFFYFTSLVT